MATHVVTGEQTVKISNRLAEIQRQVFLQKEYGHDPEKLIEHLQAAIEGRFIGNGSAKSVGQNLDWWLAKTEEFAEKHLGVRVNLRERFAIPAELPWESAIPVFDPGALTNRGMVDFALRAQGLAVWEEEDVMKYAGSEAGEAPTLHFINNSVTPDDDTMNLSPNDLRATKKSFLRLRGYGLAFAVYYFATGKYLDPKTFTWFPEDRLPGGSVAHGAWDPARREVRFYWGCAGYRSSDGGARVAMPVSLKP